jgi:hypothetical protein
VSAVTLLNGATASEALPVGSGEPFQVVQHQTLLGSKTETCKGPAPGSSPQGDDVAEINSAPANLPGEASSQTPAHDLVSALALMPATSNDAPPPSPVDLSPVEAKGDVHARFYERIEALNKERKGLWQKILSAFTGK